MKISTIKISTLLTRKLIYLAVVFILLLSPPLLLSYNPISLPFAKTYIISYITKNMPQYQVDIDQVSLYWDKDLYLPTLVVKGLQIKNLEKTELSLEQISVIPSLAGLVSSPPKPPISVYLDKFEVSLDELIQQQPNTPAPTGSSNQIQEYVAKLQQLPVAKITLRQTKLIYAGNETKVHRLSIKPGRIFQLKIAPSSGDKIDTVNLSFDIKTDGQISLQGYLYEDSPIEAQLNYDKTSLEITATCDSTATRDILNLWPKTLASGTRKWLQASLLEGELKHADFNLKAVLDKATETIKVTDVLSNLHITDATISYLNNAPLLENLDTIVRLTADRAEIKAVKATLGDLPVENLIVDITDMTGDDASLTLDGQINADLASTVKLALSHTSGKQSITSDMHGTAATNISFKMSLTRPEEKELKVISTLKEVKIDNIVGGHKIDKGDLIADYQNAMLTVKGSAIVDENIPAEVTYILPDDIKSPQRTEVKSRVTPEMVKHLGFTPPSFLTKPVTMEYARTEGMDGTQHFLTARLDNIKLTHPLLKHGDINTKGGIFKAELAYTPEGEIMLKDYELKTPTLFSKGTAVLKNDYSVASIDSEHSTMQGSDLAFSYQDTDYTRVLSLKGKSFDLSAVSLEQLLKNKEVNSKPFQLRSKLGKLIMYNNVVINKPELSVDCSPTLCTDLKLKGNLETKGSINFTLHYPDFSLYSDNAGDSLRALDIYQNMHGGLLSITAKSHAAITEGNINIQNYYLVKTPILSKLLSLTSISTISFRGIADVIQGKGINFKKLNCPITYNSGILKLEECMQEGTVMTMTGSGDINLTAQNVNVKGLIIPQNIINSLFKHLPIFNKIAGKKNGGFLAISYNIKGDLKDNPQISANPLSILAPGFLKGIGDRRKK